MSPLQQFSLPFPSQAKWLGIVALVIISALSAYSQNTKGDKPASNQKSIFRIPKLKSKSKGGDKPNTRDISGRRKIRTKNKSSAVPTIQTSPPRYANRRPHADKPYATRNGPRTMSRTADAARNNVYPNHGKFVTNPSRYPKDNQHAYSNRGVLSRAASMSTKPHPPGRKKIISPRTASRSFVTRGRKNVYWGKFRKGEKPITTDISGRTLRARNFHSPGLGVIPAGEVYKKKKKYGDQPFQGTFSKGYVTTPKRTRAWRGDVSGHAIRRRAPKMSEQAGGDSDFYGPAYLSISNKRRGLSRPLPGSGLASRPRESRISNRPIQGKAPGLGANLIIKALGRYKGKKRTTHGNVSASRGFNNGGAPIMRKAPGIGARFVDRYQGFIKGGVKAFSTDGYGFSGDLKSRRAAKGGGSISGKRWNNSGQPVPVKGPGIGGRFVDTYKGFIKGGVKTFSTDGYGFAGNLKSRRAPKGGGSISGRARDNGGQPITVKGPGIGGRFVDVYRGNIKFQRQPKGGGSISRSWNNNGQPVIVKAPSGIQAKFVDRYKGFLKGGVKAFSTDGYDYQGNLKGHRPIKGGGSISGKLWNNNEQPIQGKAFAPSARKVADFEGDKKQKHYVRNPNAKEEALKKLRPGKSTYLVGDLQIKVKASRLATNPNSKEGALKKFAPGKSTYLVGDLQIKTKASHYVRNPNAKEEALKKLAPGKSTYLVGDLQVKTKANHYVRNPNAKEEALKKLAPGKSTYLIGNLQVRAKSKSYDRNPHSSKDALKSVSNGKNSIRAIEYGNRIRQIWVKTFGDEKDLAGRIVRKKYVHNPNSKKTALMVMAPGRSYARIKDLQVNVKMLKPHGNNLHPDSKFAHSLRNNVKQERTFLMTLKLKWAKLFKKNDTQPASVKQKVRRPRYDPKERDLWKDLYD